MATIKFANNVFEEDYNTIEFDHEKTLREQIESYINVDIYKETLVECYDSETGKTFFAPIEDDVENPKVLITVDNQVVDFDYQVKDNDVITVVYIPEAWDWGWAAVGIAAGMIVGSFMPVIGVPLWLGLTAGGVIGGLLGGFIGGSLNDNNVDKNTLGKEGSQALDVRGASNQSIINNPYPFVLGKHLITPYIIGDPITEYTGDRGENPRIKVLYCAGYGPLKLTDFKLDEMFLAYNRSAKFERKTKLSGILTGTSLDEEMADSGDILDIWKNNDIKLEIIQNNPRGNLVKSKLYDGVFVDQEVNSNILYVCDGSLDELKDIVYKGKQFPNNYRTNTVLFTESYPKEFTITLDFINGLYDTFTRTSDGNTSQNYSSLPMWFAVQWRPYDRGNPSSRSDGSDYDLWNNITTFNTDINGGDFGDTYTSEKYLEDLAAHKGNSFPTSQKDLFITTLISNYNLQSEILALSSDAKSVTKSGVKIFKITGEKSKKKEVFKFTESDYTVTASSNSDVNNFYLGFLTSGDNEECGRCVYNADTQTLYFDTYVNDNDIDIGETYITHSEITSQFPVKINFYPTFTVNLYNYTRISDCSEGSYRQGSGVETVTVSHLYIPSNLLKVNTESFPSISGAWLDKQICNFQALSGEDGLAETRISATVDLTSYASQICSDNNSIKGVEVRVIRVSPCYLNQTSNESDSEGAHSYADICQIKSLVTKTFDIDEYEKSGEVVAQHPFNDKDAEKFCYIAISAKADAAGRIEGSIKKLNCIAESFSPTLDSNNHKWLPENVRKYSKYFGYYIDGEMCNRGDEGAEEVEVTKTEYESGRRAGFNWVEEKCGSTFGNKIKDIVFGKYVYSSNGTSYYEDPERTVLIDVSTRTLVPTGEIINNSTEYWYSTKVTENLGNDNIDAYYLESFKYSSPESFCDNSVASGFLLACVGQQNGPFASGYESIDMLSLEDYKNDSTDVTDGTVDNGQSVSIDFKANGYITQSIKREDLLKKICIAGRAIYTYNSDGKRQIIMDKPRTLIKGVINQQNCTQTSAILNYEDIPAGFRISFSDENDGYETNSVYCWSDGNSEKNYKGVVKPLSFDFVTNSRQLWSLGRYMLACSIQSKETLTAKIGPEGKDMSLGDLMLVQNDELLIGGGSGRVQQVIEDNGVIYGFISDTTYEYTGEFDEFDLIKQGVSILQPKKNGDSKVVTLRLRTPGSITISGITYTLEIGTTNLVLFDNGVNKDVTGNTGVSSLVKYNFETGDICMFGEINKISSKYIVSKIKPDKDNTFTFTLIPYDETLYNYGAKLPSFEKNITTPPVEIDPTSLTDVPTNLKELNDADKFIFARVNQIYSNFVITLYKKSDQQITTTGITDTLTYNFSDGSKTWKNESGKTHNGWYFTYQEAEQNGTGSMFVTAGTAFGKGVTDDIAGSEFAPPTPYGVNGSNGYSTRVIQLYKRSSQTPTDVPGELIYRFDRGTLTGDLNGWNESMPEITEDRKPMWEIHATALSTTTSATILSETWSSPVQITQDGYSKSEIMSWIESSVLETPNVYSELGSIAFSINAEGVTPVTQYAAIPIHVIQNSEELDFEIGSITLPDGMNVTRNGNSVILTVTAGTRLNSGNIVIPVIYTKYEDFEILVEDENVTWDSEQQRWIGSSVEADDLNVLVYVNDQDKRYYREIDSISNIPSNPSLNEYFYWSGINTVVPSGTVVGDEFIHGIFYSYNGDSWSESPILPIGRQTSSVTTSTFNLPFSWVTVQGGVYREAVPTIAEIPSNIAIGDYFCWTGTDEQSYSGVTGGKLLKGALYKWNGTIWDKDENTVHIANALYDELNVAEEYLHKNNSKAELYVKRLVANEVFTENITVSGTAIVNALAVASVVIGSADTNAYIQSFNYNGTSSSNPTTGFKLDGKTGKILAANGYFAGDIVASSLTLGSNVSIAQSKITNLTTDLNNKQNVINSTNKLPYSYISGTPDLNAYALKNESSKVTIGTSYKKNGITFQEISVQTNGVTTTYNTAESDNMIVFGYAKGDFTLLSSKPSDWNTDWKNYYKKSASDDTYEQLSGNSAPTWATNTYYKMGTTAVSLSKDGLLTAKNAIIWGTVYATSGKFTGEVQATSGTFNSGVFTNCTIQNSCTINSATINSATINSATISGTFNSVGSTIFNNIKVTGEADFTNLSCKVGQGDIIQTGSVQNLPNVHVVTLKMYFKQYEYETTTIQMSRTESQYPKGLVLRFHYDYTNPSLYITVRSFKAYMRVESTSVKECYVEYYSGSAFSGTMYRLDIFNPSDSMILGTLKIYFDPTKENVIEMKDLCEQPIFSASDQVLNINGVLQLPKEHYFIIKKHFGTNTTYTEIYTYLKRFILNDTCVSCLGNYGTTTSVANQNNCISSIWYNSSENEFRFYNQNETRKLTITNTPSQQIEHALNICFMSNKSNFDY